MHEFLKNEKLLIIFKIVKIRNLLNLSFLKNYTFYNLLKHGTKQTSLKSHFLSFPGDKDTSLRKSVNFYPDDIILSRYSFVIICYSLG